MLLLYLPPGNCALDRFVSFLNLVTTDEYFGCNCYILFVISGHLRNDLNWRRASGRASWCYLLPIDIESNEKMSAVFKMRRDTRYNLISHREMMVYFVLLKILIIQVNSSYLIGGSLVTCHSLKVLIHGDVIIPFILRSIHFVLMHVRVKQCDRRVFLTFQSIPNTNWVWDYVLGSETP